jgi:hypothetical protein
VESRKCFRFQICIESQLATNSFRLRIFFRQVLDFYFLREFRIILNKRNNRRLCLLLHRMLNQNILQSLQVLLSRIFHPYHHLEELKQNRIVWFVLYFDRIEKLQ